MYTNGLKISSIERDVARLIAKGYKDEEIAQELYISRRSVAKYVALLKKRWKVRSRVSIGVMVCHLGWLDPSDKVTALLEKMDRPPTDVPIHGR
ncbi:response regulator transcription factor [Desmospora profundinema]|uniref:NarL family two-component system response regulator LiaR n=1 Tax=Desmospora profundinema TaxID=1571184 RepID=A0ABU1IQD4_9BACL|nr:LuxR C-terminal-related transcriptional regulator [Desmospora profundinema]MDR6227011.1 NarL family two-component system response regulator LiaR [Desmospora profundinema]